MAWPEKILDGMPRNLALDHLYHQRTKMLAQGDRFAESEMHQPGQEWLLGYALPPFQRPSVWTQEQQRRFCESAILGLSLGTWVCNVSQEHPTSMVEGRECFHITDNWLIDGQQRFRALDAWWSDEVEVFGLKWSDVDRVRQKKFLMHTHFEAFEIRTTDLGVLREIYDRLNFGGTPHSPDQRATRDDEDLVPTSGPRM